MASEEALDQRFQDRVDLLGGLVQGGLRKHLTEKRPLERVERHVDDLRHCGISGVERE